MVWNVKLTLFVSALDQGQDEFMNEVADLQLLIESKPKDLGGFQVRRALPVAQKRFIGPFVFFDEMGPVDFKIGQGMDVRPHPHIGLSTLTYLFQGEIVHKDTLGVEQIIAPGAVNWMTAGSGVAHSERSAQEKRAHPQRLHGLQIWIALPKDQEEVTATFHHHSAKEIPELSIDGNQVRVVAGDVLGQRSPVRAYSPLVYLDVKLQRGKKFRMPMMGFELGVYVVSGSVQLGSKIVRTGSLGVFSNAEILELTTTENSQIMILGGKVFPEERHIWWNFVSSSKDRIERAKKDWREQNFGKIKGETELIPLPEDR